MTVSGILSRGCRMKDDLISRQDAIRWVKTECNPYGKPTLEFESGKKVIEHLEHMPSAQPDVSNTNVGDCISRQAALNSPVTMVSEGIDWIPAYHIKELPSAQPLDVQIAYLRGVNDGIEQCTERIKRISDEVRERYAK